MKQADAIRRFVLRTYIDPARAKGARRVRIRAGDVHEAMGLTARLPAVASALGAEKFEEYARVRLIDREGPHLGANLIFTFSLE